MNNNIKEDYCSLEVSKLLKEKGFKISSFWYYTLREETKGLIGKVNIGTKRCHTGAVSDNAFIKDDNYAWSPTHSLAIKWIRENFGWNIQINYQPENDDYLIVIIKLGHIDSQEKRTQISNIRGFNSSEEATEAALLYTLKNLIK